MVPPAILAGGVSGMVGRIYGHRRRMKDGANIAVLCIAIPQLATMWQPRDSSAHSLRCVGARVSPESS